MLTRFRVQPSYNSSALPNFVLDGNGEWVAYQDAMQAIATARAEALREAAEKQWVSVKDSLPEYKQLVAVCDATEDEPAVFMAFYFATDQLWALGDVTFADITHWMPLPEPAAILADKQESTDADS